MSLNNNPPSREEILSQIESLTQPASFKKLLTAFGIKHKHDSNPLLYRLKAMVRDKQLIYTNGVYVIPSTILVGKVQFDYRFKPYVICEKGLYYLSESNAKIIFEGDQVQIKILGLESAEIDSIVKRECKFVTGFIYSYMNQWYLQPINRSYGECILVCSKVIGNNLKRDSLVTAQIVSYPTDRSLAVVSKPKVIDVSNINLDLALQIAYQAFSWRDHHKDYENFTTASTIHEDYTHIPFCTIDGPDTQDIDDAVYARPNIKGGYDLYVGIADVSHYVKPKTSLDKEAWSRCTSIYPPSTAIHMLPTILSQDICSLVPEKSRLSVVLCMHINAQGNLKSYEFTRGIIKSRAKLTYQQVEIALLSKGLNFESQTLDKEIFTSLEHLHALYLILRKKRSSKGATLFNMQELKLFLDKSGMLQDNMNFQGLISQEIIEECMIMANTACGQELEKKHIKGIYRIHPEPQKQIIKDICEYASQCLDLKLNYKETLERASIDPRIQGIIMRNLTKAEYAVKNIGHYGIGTKVYTHFTSPIRRYADIIAHRLLFSKHPITLPSLEVICKQASIKDRKADRISYYVQDLLVCNKISRDIAMHGSKLLVGTIASIAERGMYIFLYHYGVEGYLSFNAIQGDYYTVQPGNTSVVGKVTKKTYSLGATIYVRINKVYQLTKIDLQLDFF